MSINILISEIEH